MISDAIRFYYKACELKEMIRQGAKQWRVNRERLESVAEHTFGCLMLAIALESELSLSIDLGKVLEMLTIHELEEIVIGDITPLSHENKSEMKALARSAVQDMFRDLKSYDKLLSLTDEYNAGESREARFCKAVDKLECVLEFKKYQDACQVSLEHITPEMLENARLKEYVDSGKYDLADIFFLFHQPAYKDFGIDEELWYTTLKNLKI